MNNSFIYYLNISIRNNKIITSSGYFQKYNDINFAIKDGINYIHKYIEDYYNNDQDDIDYIYNQNNDIEFSKEFDLSFNIICINERKPMFTTNEDIFNIIYNNYKESNNLFDSILNVVDCKLYLDFKGNIEDCDWDSKNIQYIPIIDKDVNEFKYPIGTKVEYLNGVYIIIGHSKFDPKRILTGNIDNINTYSMYGIRNGYFDHIRLDDNINESQLTTNISYNNKYLINFVSFLKHIVDNSSDNGVINIDYIMRKYYYWMATGNIQI